MLSIGLKMLSKMIVLLQVSGERDFFAKMCVDAVSCLDPSTLDLKMIGMKKVIGGWLLLLLLLRITVSVGLSLLAAACHLSYVSTA
jgi:hypothetical protein